MNVNMNNMMMGNNMNNMMMGYNMNNPMMGNNMNNQMMVNNNMNNMMMNNNMNSPMMGYNMNNMMMNNNINNMANNMNNMAMANNANMGNNMMMGNNMNNMVMTNNPNNFGNNMMGNNMTMGNNMMMGDNMMMKNNMNNNIMINGPMMGNNMGRDSTNINIMDNNMLNNQLLEPNIQMISPYDTNNFFEFRQKMNSVFQISFPNFIEMNPKDVQKKKIWEKDFLELYSRFNGIKKGQKRENEITIFINYYDFGRKELFVNKELKVEYLISDILHEMGWNFGKIIYKRYSNNQTTKFIIENPIRSISKCIFELDDLSFQLEYNGKNLIESFEKKLSEIGLTEGKVINVLFTKELTNEPTEKINIEFKKSNGFNTVIIINKNATLKDAIKKYAMITGINFDSIGNSIVMHHNKNEIKKADYCKTLGEFEINNFSKIMVNDPYGIIGGGMMVDFVDVSTGKIKKLDFSENAPNWRGVNKGLNIFGICTNPKCEVFKKEVVYPTFFKEKLIFVLNDELPHIRCPICFKIFDPKTCGFWKCEYQFVGKRIKEGELMYFDSKTKETNEDDFEYFDIFENGEARWFELTIYVLPKQDMKYQSN